MAKAEILAIRDVSTDFTRPGVMTHKEVTYQFEMPAPVAGQPPVRSAVYILFIPISEYSSQRAKEEVEKRRSEWNDIVGQTLG